MGDCKVDVFDKQNKNITYLFLEKTRQAHLEALMRN